jgi:hypothetical protein
MAWRIARSLLAFHAQLRTTYSRAAPPATDVKSWGTIGDTSHASTSDHSPHNFPGWGNDIVTAADWPHAPALGLDAGVVAEALRGSRDARIKYVIFNRRMFSSYYSGTTPGWTWRPYTGSDPHDTHGHLSVVGDVRADSEQPWQVRAPVVQSSGGTSMQQVLARAVPGSGPIWLCDGIRRRIVADDLVSSVQWLGTSGAIGPLWNNGAVWEGAALDAFGVPDSHDALVTMLDALTAAVAALPAPVGGLPFTAAQVDQIVTALTPVIKAQALAAAQLAETI